MDIELSLDEDFFFMDAPDLYEDDLACQKFMRASAAKFNLAPLELLKYPSNALSDFEDHSNAEECAKIKEEMIVVTKTAYYEPIIPSYDDLDTLGSEWWDFNGKISESDPQKDFDDLLDKTDLSGGYVLAGEGAEPFNNLILKEEVKRIGCRCGMTKCLRLHCRCFRDLEYCAKNCRCTSCFNDMKHEEVRDFVIKKTKEINKKAFAKSIVFIENGEEGKINSEGCICKTGCNRNYCECFKNKTGCSPLCKCSGCLNTSISFPASQAKSLFKGTYRTKNKIILTGLENLKGQKAREASAGHDHGQAHASTENGSETKRVGPLVAVYQKYKRVKTSEKA
jgi:hypothetical protein